MRPVIYELPLPWGTKLPLHGYGFMIVIGFLLACYVSSREARRRGLPDFVYDLGLVMLFGGLFVVPMPSAGAPAVSAGRHPRTVEPAAAAAVVVRKSRRFMGRLLWRLARNES